MKKWMNIFTSKFNKLQRYSAKQDDDFVKVGIISDGEIHALTTTMDNTIWAGLDHDMSYSKLYKKAINEGTFTEIMKPDNIVSNLVRDKDDNLWMSTKSLLQKGEVFVKYAGTDSFTKAEGISGAVWILTADDNGTIWAGVVVDTAGHENLSIIYKKAPNENQFTAVQNLTGIVLALVAKNNTVWAGLGVKKSSSEDIGVIYKKEATNRHFFQLAELDSAIRSLAIDNNNTVWAGTYGSLYQKAATTNSFSRIKNINAVSVNSIIVDQNNTVWIGTSYGSSRGYIYKKKNSENEFSKIDYTFEAIYNLTIADNKTLIVGASDNNNITSIYKNEKII